MSEPPSDPQPWYEDVVIPALLRAARNAYAVAVRQALAMGDYEDMPANGPYLIGSIARSGAPLSQVIKELGVSKQAAGQLVDTLVLRGYLVREVDTVDRRRLTLTLTERGMGAHLASRAAVERVDAKLAARMAPAAISQGRAMLAALAMIGRQIEAEGLGGIETVAQA